MRDMASGAPSDDRGFRPGRAARRVVLGALLVAVLVIGGPAFRVWEVARADGRQPVDTVTVLGAAQYDGKPSAALRARLDQALELHQQGLTRNIVTVGGRQHGDDFTEAQAGRKWLVERGVPPDRITEIDVGDDTLSSARAVAGLAQQRGWDTALLVTDPWHSLRARTMINDFGLRTWSSPTRSGPMVQTRATQLEQIYRETGGLLYYRLTHAPAEMLGDSFG